MAMHCSNCKKVQITKAYSSMLFRQFRQTVTVVRHRTAETKYVIIHSNTSPTRVQKLLFQNTRIELNIQLHGYSVTVR